MPSFELAFEVFCAQCGAGLCQQSTTGESPRRGMPFVQVQPCKSCLDGERNDGYDRGYANGEKAVETD